MELEDFLLHKPGKMDGECRGDEEGWGAGDEAVDATELVIGLARFETGRPAFTVSTRTTVFSCLRNVDALALNESE